MGNKEAKKSATEIALDKRRNMVSPLGPLQENVQIVGKLLSEFGIVPEIITALESKSIQTLFPVQAETLNYIREGTDLVTQARTGSGKTLAFGIPIAELILRERPNGAQGIPVGFGPLALVFVPTRELAIQVNGVMASILPRHRCVTLYGGVAYSTQEHALERGCDVVVATPGRCKDMLERGNLRVDQVRLLVLDEADRMLDIGFKDEIEYLMGTVLEQNGSEKGSNHTHQTLMFSATVPEWISRSNFLLPNRKLVNLIGQHTTQASDTISFYRRKCQPREISSMLTDLIRVYSGKHGRALVFLNTKRECHELSLSNTLKLDCQSLHGDMQQDQRESTMKSFRANKFAVLLATDVAARGLDLPEVDLVIQAAPPGDFDSFIHRAGRTGRAGRRGVCILLHTQRDEGIVGRLERHAKIKFNVLPPPTQKEIMSAVVRDVTEDLSRVDRKATNLFYDDAVSLLQEADAAEILASALAVMSGYTEKIHKRGLLSGVENFATVLSQQSRPMSIRAWCYALRSQLGDSLFMQCKEVACTEDGTGCVFDISLNAIRRVLSASDSRIELKEIEQLPPLGERQTFQYRRENGGGGYDRGRFGRGGGFYGRGGGGYPRGGQQYGGRGGGNLRYGGRGRW